MTRVALAMTAALLLVAPAGADAKRIQKVRLCGQDACYTWNWDNSRGKLALFDTTGYTATTAPTVAAPWYRMHVWIGPDGDEAIKPFKYAAAYLPHADLIRQPADSGGFEWVEVIDDLKPVLRNEASRLAPFSPDSLGGIAAARASAPQPPTPPQAPDNAGMAWAWILLAGGAAAALALGFRRRASLG